ncbi:hypothetical protein [Pseudactinotalea suaedae]|jgi:hypothetical protein|uniref:hypothetical protein n=1 Tax=Pseudactinotalea suaedae TaxID=1524924 RepID=UPI0012E1EA49|nr:hypothetical protein [Pseudactinotalea suaedae]
MSWVTGKVWELVEGGEEADLLVLVEEQIEPRYAELHADVTLGLMRLEGRRYLTTQTWPDRRTWEEAITGERYERWFARYRPVLALWDASVTFVFEWAGEEIR